MKMYLLEGKIVRAVRLNQEYNRIYYLSDNGLQATGVSKIIFVKDLPPYKMLWLNAIIEFDESEKNITTEFSVSLKDLKEFIEFTRNGYISKKGKWIFFDCNTCRLDHGDEYIHASLINKKDLEGAI